MSFFPQNIYLLSNSSCLIQIQNFKEHVYRSIRDKQTHLLKATSSKGPLTQSAVTIVLSRLSLCLPVSLVLAFYQPWLALISDDSFSTLSPLNVWQLNFRSRLLFSPKQCRYNMNPKKKELKSLQRKSITLMAAYFHSSNKCMGQYINV